jgi:hypothetical protein
MYKVIKEVNWTKIKKVEEVYFIDLLVVAVRLYDK